MAVEEPLLQERPAAPSGAGSVNGGDERAASGWGGRLTRNQRRLIGLLGVLAILAVAIAVVIEVAGKDLAQEALDNSEMDIKLMTVTDVGPDYLTADISVDVDNRYPVKAELEAFTVDMKFDADGSGRLSKLGSVSMPSVTLEASALNHIEMTGRTLHVSSQDVFNAFAGALFMEATVTVHLVGSVTARADGLKYTLDVNKAVDLVGVNGFSDPAPEVLVVYINDTAADAITLDFDVLLVSAATVAFEDIGGLNLTIAYEEVDVGYAACLDSPVALQPGETTFRFRGELVRNADNAQTIADAIGALASGTVLDLKLSGNAQSTPYPLLSGAMEQLWLVSALDGLDVLHTEDHPFVMFSKNDEGNSTWADLPIQLLYSFAAVRPQDAGQGLFQQVFGVFRPVADALPHAGCKGQSTHRMGTTISVLLNNPLPFETKVIGFDINIFWAGDPDAAALGYPEFAEKMIYGTGINWKTAEDPVLTVGPYGTAIQEQLLCTVGAMDDISTLATFLGGYLPARYSPGHPLYLASAEATFQLMFDVNATMSVQVGDLVLENVPFSEDGISSINVILGSE